MRRDREIDLAPLCNAHRPVTPRAARSRGPFRGGCVGLLVGICLLAAVGAPSAMAEEIPPGETVRQIEFRNLTRTSADALKGLLRTQEGEPFSQDALREDQRTLFGRDLYCERVDWEPVPGGIKLIFVMVDFPRITKVEVKGFKKHRKELLAASGLVVGRSASDYSLSLARVKVEQYLIEKGYMYAAVEVNAEEIGGNNRAITIQIEPGPKAQVKELTFEGNAAFSDSELKKYMHTKIDRWYTSNVYQRDVLNDDAARLLSLYNFKGYLNANVGHHLRDSSCSVRWQRDSAEPRDPGSLETPARPDVLARGSGQGYQRGRTALQDRLPGPGARQGRCHSSLCTGRQCRRSTFHHPGRPRRPRPPNPHARQLQDPPGCHPAPGRHPPRRRLRRGRRQ
jgi:hypothetical protein